MTTRPARLSNPNPTTINPKDSHYERGTTGGQVRGSVWWAKGYVEYNGTRITRYYRVSTRASTEAGAREWCRIEEERQIRSHLFGEETVLTFLDAVMDYNAKPAYAACLAKIIPEIGEIPLSKITPNLVKSLGPKLYPNCCTDTWFRHVVSPIRVVINNAHQMGRGTPPIRISAYTQKERIEQDQARGKQSRIRRKPFTKEWVEAFSANASPYNAAMVRFIFQTGARIDQAISLVTSDLDLMNKRVWVKAQKGHEAQWVDISIQMAADLAKLPPKQPKNTKTNKMLPARVFGYASRGGYRKAWRSICEKAGIPPLLAHSGRHGFYTELRVRQGVDPITAAKAGRWKNAALPDALYAHVEADMAEIRERFGTNLVQDLKQEEAKTLKRND